ncbi:MAG: hypothetical protein PUG85_02640, partial [Oscillospiraceae bacterium]|nr:hypothetical protein [Oscillospiraceae bacterium]
TAVRIEPQAKAVELAQLGEGDSPRCGEMSRRDKRGGHPLKKGGKLHPAKQTSWNRSMNEGQRS